MITTEGKTTEQVIAEIFAKLVEQGKPCFVAGRCAYGDEEGNHCAVGWLLPPDDDRLMGLVVTVDDLCTTMPSRLGPNGSWIQENSGLLCHIQNLHDFTTDPPRPRSVRLCLSEIERDFPPEVYQAVCEHAAPWFALFPDFEGAIPVGESQ